MGVVEYGPAARRHAAGHRKRYIAGAKEGADTTAPLQPAGADVFSTLRIRRPILGKRFTDFTRTPADGIAVAF